MFIHDFILVSTFNSKLAQRSSNRIHASTYIEEFQENIYVYNTFILNTNLLAPETAFEMTDGFFEPIFDIIFRRGTIQMIFVHICDTFTTTKNGARFCVRSVANNH